MVICQARSEEADEKDVRKKLLLLVGQGRLNDCMYAGAACTNTAFVALPPGSSSYVRQVRR